MASRRALHFVLKIGNRSKSIDFFRNVLGMKVLRHEEFADGCKATCNGPYDGKWSKTMIGYGDEDNNFVLELTYNYGVGGYTLGNDLIGVTVQSNNVLLNIKLKNIESQKGNGFVSVTSPDGYKFFVREADDGVDRISRVTLSSSSLGRSVDYWNRLLSMDIIGRDDKKAILGYDPNQCKLELVAIEGPVNHEKAFGRIAFSCPEDQLSSIESKMKAENQKILTPLVSLDTPGKATVQVVILGDPDGHEICFVGDNAFRQLSQIDPKADEELNKAMTEDKSDEWFQKKGLSKDKV